MGGKIFTQPPHGLSTPRLPPEVYHHVKSSCLQSLSTVFPHAAAPIDAPGKKDHGDVDILVVPPDPTPLGSFSGCVLSDPAAARLVDQISQLLDARYRIVEQGHKQGMHIHYAVPWPTGFPAPPPQPTPPAPLSPAVTGSEAALTQDDGLFVQVDIHVCRTKTQMDWFLFRNAHGDMWAILGTVIKPYGLTLDDHALHIRIPLLEDLDRRKARVPLTSDPVIILDLLGLQGSTEGSEEGRYFKGPFESAEAMFTYIAQCPMFCTLDFIHDSSEPLPLKLNTDVHRDEAEEGATEDDTPAKAVKNKNRPQYRQFVETFVPQRHRDNHPLYTARRTSREQVQQEAFDTFPGVRHAFEQTRKRHLADLTRQQASQIIGNALSKMEADENARQLAASSTVTAAATVVSSRTTACRTRKRRAAKVMKTLLMGDGADAAAAAAWEVPIPKNVRDEEGVYDLDVIRTWVQQWKEMIWEKSVT